ncbi:hypothetical protein ABW19_dt0206745 [Dactylella cylindrospora]|nr:hypothetical protein ABW19_dt0206745 [Dactylella cylindrospora]
MAIEDTWYDYYHGPTPASTFSEKLQPHLPNITVTTPPHRSPSHSPHPHGLSPSIDYSSPLAPNNVFTEKERRARIRASHTRERQVVTVILELLCQVAGFTCAIVFGIWAVKSYNVSVVALKVQTVANQLSLRGMCESEATLANSEKCKRLLAASVDQLWDADFIDNAMAGTEIAMPKLSLGAIVGIVIGSVAGFLIFNIIFAIWRRRQMIMQLNSHVGTDLSNLEAGHGPGGGMTLHNLSTIKPDIKMFSANKKDCKASTNTSMVSVSTDMSSSTKYSGNPLAPNGTGPPKRRWTQASHVLYAY